MIENILVLSTAHITLQTNDLLNQLKPVDVSQELDPDDDRMPFRFIAHHYGYIIFLSDYSKEEEFMQKVVDRAQDIAMVIDYAIKKNCTMINLDRDADTTFDLPTYKW
jgi:hypothetical protein